MINMKTQPDEIDNKQTATLEICQQERDERPKTAK